MLWAMKCNSDSAMIFENHNRHEWLQVFLCDIRIPGIQCRDGFLDKSVHNLWRMTVESRQWRLDSSSWAMMMNAPKCLFREICSNNITVARVDINFEWHFSFTSAEAEIVIINDTVLHKIQWNRRWQIPRNHSSEWLWCYSCRGPMRKCWSYRDWLLRGCVGMERRTNPILSCNWEISLTTLYERTRETRDFAVFLCILDLLMAIKWCIFPMWYNQS